MAAVTSLGIHRPTALPYLITEGLVHKDIRRDDYHWETYVFDDGGGPVEHEIFATKHCVAWSRGKFIKAVFPFDREHEHVIHAVLTSFPPASLQHLRRDQALHDTDNGINPGHKPKSGSQHTERSHDHKSSTSTARALVILLQKKAHIYFVHGEQHITDLPVDIERAFPTPRGLVIQRKVSESFALPDTPHAPQNSFASVQGRQSFPHIQSPTVANSFRSSQSANPGLLSRDNNVLDSLYDGFAELWRSQNVPDLPRLYTLTGPLSDIGIVAHAAKAIKPSSSVRGRRTTMMNFESLEPAERIIYISPENELANIGDHPKGLLILMVTYNDEKQTSTLWHAWYIEESSTRDLLSLRAEQKAARARRRSSFAAANIGTDAATPAMRHRDGPRESFAATTHAQSSRPPTLQEEEEAFVSQMDPDLQPVGMLQGVNETRRISSLMSRGEIDPRVSHTSVAPSFAGHGGRRNMSFGGVADRRSFVPARRSRASTPGSTFSRSFGTDGDTMTLDDDSDMDGEESIDHTLRHIRATHEAATAVSSFTNVDESYKPELIIQKIHAIDLTTSPPSRATQDHVQRLKVVVFSDSLPSNAASSAIHVWIRDSHHPEQEISRIILNVHHRRLWPNMPDGPIVAVPSLVDIHRVPAAEDLIKLKNGVNECVLFNSGGLLFDPSDEQKCPLPPNAPYRMFDTLAEFSAPTALENEAGKNRTLQTPQLPLTTAFAGIGFSFDEVDADGTHHRRQLKLTPSNPDVIQMLNVCERVLPVPSSHDLRKMWCVAFAAVSQRGSFLLETSCTAEMVALASAILSYDERMLDDRARASLKLARLAASNHPTLPEASQRISSQHQREGYHLMGRPWSWMDENRTSIPRASAPVSKKSINSPPLLRKDQFIPLAMKLGEELQLARLTSHEARFECPPASCAVKLMSALHIFREEQKLNVLNHKNDAAAAIIAQIAMLGGPSLHAWTSQPGTALSLDGAGEDRWAYVGATSKVRSLNIPIEEPKSIFEWWERCIKDGHREYFPTLDFDASYDQSGLRRMNDSLTPRINAISRLVHQTNYLTASAINIVEEMARSGITTDFLETLPEAFAAPLREAIARCERAPPSTWPPALLQLVGRQDLIPNLDETFAPAYIAAPSIKLPTRDAQTISNALEQPNRVLKSKEASRNAVSQLIFSEDRRLVEVMTLMHFNSVQVAECPQQMDWSDAQHLEQQRKVTHWVMARMIAIPPGDGMLHYDSQMPLMTERYSLPGFNSNCIMYPMGHTVTTDRSGLTEERVNWAYFHAGVSAGLRISHNAKRIDTSWIVYNKPNELTNRHAGLLLALGLGGHLRSLAKWMSFKYLTPKHTMTSVGLLLGLSASYLGTADSLITRMLSVHITSLLPPGAADLNVSPTTQTAGLMGIGLLYYDTQHRRMSETMLSEIENMDIEDPDNGPDSLRDESYRLAAGLALGFINLGRGKNLQSLHGVQLPERLLAVAVGSHPVHAVHVFDKANAGAIVALALVYMKTNDESIARKIDVPVTEAQLDQIRPDMLLLRTMAKHLVMWDKIKVAGKSSRAGAISWIKSSLPTSHAAKLHTYLLGVPSSNLSSSDIPFFNVCAGLAWALSLKYAGSGNLDARDEVLTLLECFSAHKDRGDSYYYDSKLAKASLRRCIDVFALSAATIMAGTGDLQTYRFLRRLHGRVDAETPYGSHMAAHLAIGTLFLGGGTYTFNTSNLAIASLICATYPLFPNEVQDNSVHLQAFRHLWVFAAEARCIVVYEVDTQRPITIPINVRLKDRTELAMRAPCLLPELDTISAIHIADVSYWEVTLDFANSPAHLAAFRKHQRVQVRRRPVTEGHSSVFSSTLAALDESDSRSAEMQSWDWLFNLPALQSIDKAAAEVILPRDIQSSVYFDDRSTVTDDRLVLERSANSNDKAALWNLRCLFAWEETMKEDGQRLLWLPSADMESLKAKIEERLRTAGEVVPANA